MPSSGFAVPAIGIVVPTHNRDYVLPRALNSVFQQSFVDFELIVVDDGSTDETRALLAGLDDPRLRYVHQPNQGVSIARNTGAALSTADYLTFLDSDDEVAPHWLETLVQAFRRDRNTAIVCVGATMIENGARTLRLPRELGPLYRHQAGLFAPPGTFAVRRELFHAVGGYTPGLAHSENTDLALRLVTNCLDSGQSIECVLRPLVTYNREALRWARNEEKFRLRVESAEHILEQHGHRYRAEFPAGYANYCAVAGVNAARLGQWGRARHHLLAALRVDPGNWRHYARLSLALIPPLGRRYWLRYRDAQES